MRKLRHQIGIGIGKLLHHFKVVRQGNPHFIQSGRKGRNLVLPFYRDGMAETACFQDADFIFQLLDVVNFFLEDNGKEKQGRARRQCCADQKNPVFIPVGIESQQIDIGGSVREGNGIDVGIAVVAVLLPVVIDLRGFGRVIEKGAVTEDGDINDAFSFGPGIQHGIVCRRNLIAAYEILKAVCTFLFFPFDISRSLQDIVHKIAAQHPESEEHQDAHGHGCQKQKERLRSQSMKVLTQSGTLSPTRS